MLEKIRLNKYISLCGVCSRRDADRYIDQGRVSVDGAVAKQPAPLVDGSEVITVDGKPIQTVDDVKVWAFYKPAGLVTTHRDEQGRETVFEYLREQGVDERVISVGRLDLNSEGLLLLTNNGEFSRFAESPQTEWKRVYRVRVFGDITYREVNVEPEKDFAQKGQNSWLQVTLTEGKNREIRRIMDYFDLSVNRLIRTSYGPYELGDLQPGEWRDEVVIRD